MLMLHNSNNTPNVRRSKNMYRYIQKLFLLFRLPTYTLTVYSIDEQRAKNPGKFRLYLFLNYWIPVTELRFKIKIVTKYQQKKLKKELPPFSCKILLFKIRFFNLIHFEIYSIQKTLFLRYKSNKI